MLYPSESLRVRAEQGADAAGAFDGKSGGRIFRKGHQLYLRRKKGNPPLNA